MVLLREVFLDGTAGCSCLISGINGLDNCSGLTDLMEPVGLCRFGDFGGGSMKSLTGVTIPGVGDVGATSIVCLTRTTGDGGGVFSLVVLRGAI